MQPAACGPLHDTDEELLAPSDWRCVGHILGGWGVCSRSRRGPGSVFFPHQNGAFTATRPQASNAGGQFPQAPAAGPRGERSAGTDAPAAPCRPGDATNGWGSVLMHRRGAPVCFDI